MALDISKVDPNIISALRNRGCEPEKMTAEEAFDEYCEWRALRGWGPHLRQTWQALQEAQTHE